MRIGGIVDIQTRHPLNSDGGQQTDFSVTESHNTLAKSPTFETFGLWSNTFADHTVGALLSASYSKGRVVQQGLDTFSGYSAFKDASSSAPTTTRFGDADVRAQRIDDREKLGFTGVLQWRPSSGMEFTADTFYSKQTADRDRHWIAFNPTADLNSTPPTRRTTFFFRAARPHLYSTTWKSQTSVPTCGRVQVWSRMLFVALLNRQDRLKAIRRSRSAVCSNKTLIGSNCREGNFRCARHRKSARSAGVASNIPSGLLDIYDSLRRFPQIFDRGWRRLLAGMLASSRRSVCRLFNGWQRLYVDDACAWNAGRRHSS